ncbi:P-type type IV conjugative transfer system protein TrbJ/VirB5 (plasmid) [Campylobacter novaezeelandiae]|uniref:Type IV secretion system protein VirB5 n=1 Tax=Campylobacter novaezeelandiae TaxID=2267891 RepID=A0A4Q9JUX0_9BACT|nr:type IV secretion system protein [Campylobacter novaezeelandiae]QWU80888.1 P-type type IV conjugative transfer system protein TrbJ/VirB5 [Campylobacter novaezeelandiae]TBR79542.1 hypothetical protein DU473_07050 [Campylobacter novaezeelandiae]
MKINKLFLSLFFSTSLFSSGIPVIDAASIAQAVTNYKQMITQYQQMIKDTANFEKQMKEFGVDMSSISEILGDTKSLISQTQSLYDNIKAIPDDFYGEIEDITRACNFMEKESSFFQIKIKKAETKYIDKVNTCISAISDTTEVDKSIQQLNQKLLTLTKNDTKTYNETLIQIQNLENAKQYLSSKANQDKINKMLSFYDNYQKNESNNPYTKVKMDKDLKELSKQLLKANNQKQAQALTNAILIKILEMTQRQYELNIYFSQAVASLGINGGNTQINKSPSFDLTYEEPQDPKEYNPYLKDIQQQPKDENGFPIFTF